MGNVIPPHPRINLSGMLSMVYLDPTGLEKYLSCRPFEKKKYYLQELVAASIGAAPLQVALSKFHSETDAPTSPTPFLLNEPGRFLRCCPA